jgi:hypothetical protein
VWIKLKLSSNKKRDSELLFRLVRKASDGKGVLYDVSIFNNGRFTYLGYVNQFGSDSSNSPNHEENSSEYKFKSHEFNLDKDELDNIRNLYNKVNIDKLKELYDCEMTDDRETNLFTFIVGNVGSMYIKDVSAICNYPQELGDLISFIDGQIKLKIN